jgi:hypothetical protein
MPAAMLSGAAARRHPSIEWCGDLGSRRVATRSISFASPKSATAVRKKAFTKTLTFKPGQWQKAVVIPVLPDVDPEANETVTVTL